jgi:hypothetical protein
MFSTWIWSWAKCLVFPRSRPGNPENYKHSRSRGRKVSCVFFALSSSTSHYSTLCVASLCGNSSFSYLFHQCMAQVWRYAARAMSVRFHFGNRWARFRHVAPPPRQALASYQLGQLRNRQAASIGQATDISMPH